eukprot:Gregarina_sp_Poly_1__9@NODE_1001_length_5410_cov_144_854950_g702_i0_p6_GENE_NODE_1001_length_5410_cov_144_854950_g702_i0NODE_1001_length_5410_cov_144_854950_g702_i0_p6_ORF_typecomplete_len137_score25_35_NODE_1001_length_5410_cov_144_854950_g702_i080490
MMMFVQIGCLWKCLLCGTVFIDTVTCLESLQEDEKESQIFFDRLSASVLKGVGTLPESPSDFSKEKVPTRVRLLPCPTCVEIALRQPYERVIDEALAQANVASLRQTRAIPARGRLDSSAILESSDNLDLPLFPSK